MPLSIALEEIYIQLLIIYCQYFCGYHGNGMLTTPVNTLLLKSLSKYIADPKRSL